MVVSCNNVKKKTVCYQIFQKFAVMIEKTAIKQPSLITTKYICVNI